MKSSKEWRELTTGLEEISQGYRHGTYLLDQASGRLGALEHIIDQIMDHGERFEIDARAGEQLGYCQDLANRFRGLSFRYNGRVIAGESHE